MKHTEHDPLQDMMQRSTVVCVTNQMQCERLIKAGRLIADMSHTNLTVISVVSPEQQRTGTDALEYLYEVSKQNGAVMSIIYNDDPFGTITDFIKQNKAINVVTGLREGQNSILPKLWRDFDSTHFFTVTLEGEVRPSGHKAPDASAGI